jgi:hypothetical protein
MPLPTMATSYVATVKDQIPFKNRESWSAVASGCRLFLPLLPSTGGRALGYGYDIHASSRMPFRQSVMAAPLFAFMASFAPLHRLRHGFVCVMGSTSLVQPRFNIIRCDVMGQSGLPRPDGIESAPKPF